MPPPRHSPLSAVLCLPGALHELKAGESEQGATWTPIAPMMLRISTCTMDKLGMSSVVYYTAMKPALMISSELAQSASEDV